MRLLLSFFIVLCVAPASRAHIGSPNVFYDGQAGPYPIRVVIRPPGVVPGVADISIRLAASAVSSVSVTPVFWNAGEKGAPPPDMAQRVAGLSNLFSASLWLMEPGAYSVHVFVNGASGTGRAIVPVDSIAAVRRPMPRGLGVILGGLGVFLVIFGIKIVGVTAGEGALPLGAPITQSARHRARIAQFAALAVLLLLGFVGKRWWDSEDSHYRNNTLYRPVAVAARTFAIEHRRVLQLDVHDDNPIQYSWTPLIPDHGKLMHLFLIRHPALDAFAHLHPVQRESRSFDVSLPALPPGEYLIYADVTHENGFSQTLTAKVAIALSPAAERHSTPALDSRQQTASAPPIDPDDSWHQGDPSPAPNHFASATPNPAIQTARLSNGDILTWDRPAELRANQETSLQFRLADNSGRTASLEPYMGMLAHAAVRSKDGRVFAHLHPMGTISMAAQQFFTRQSRSMSSLDDTAASSAATSLHHSAMPGMSAPSEAPAPEHAMHYSSVQPMGMSPASPVSSVTIPYEFPAAGEYRLWVQIKRSGQVLTAVFDAAVH